MPQQQYRCLYQKISASTITLDGNIALCHISLAQYIRANTIVSVCWIICSISVSFFIDLSLHFLFKSHVYLLIILCVLQLNVFKRKLEHKNLLLKILNVPEHCRKIKPIGAYGWATEAMRFKQWTINNNGPLINTETTPNGIDKLVRVEKERRSCYFF